MNLLKQLFGKTAPTTATISSEIGKTENELKTVRAQINAALAGLSTFTDEQHIAAEAKQAELKRAEARWAARIIELSAALATAQAAEAEAERIAAEAQRVARKEAARTAVMVEAPKLLREYDDLAEKVVAALGKIAAIDAEAAAVNVPGINRTHRKHPDQAESQRTEPRECWIYRFPGSPADTDEVKFQKEAPREEVRPASFTATGDVIPVGPVLHRYYGREIIVNPTLETRDIVVERTRERAGAYLPGFGEVRLPPGSLDSKWHWPRPVE